MKTLMLTMLGTLLTAFVVGVGYVVLDRIGSDDEDKNTHTYIINGDGAVSDQEAIPAPTIRSYNTRGNGSSRADFAECLNHVGEQIALLPWNYDVLDKESGSSWQLSNYASHELGQAYVTVYRLIHCSPFAPIAKDDEQLGRCVIDNVKHIRQAYPGGVIQADALVFALTMCIPLYEPD